MLRIITRLNIGGPSIQAIALSHRLEAFGYRTHLVHGTLGADEGDMRYLLNGSTLPVTYIPSLQRRVAPMRDLRAMTSLYRLMCATAPAIVHTHMAKAGALGRAAAALYNRTTGRRRPARVVHTYHGHVLEGYFNPAQNSTFLRAERVLARLTDRLVAISPEIRDDLLHAYHIGREDQYVVIPLGFDLSPFANVNDDDRRAARIALGIPSGVPVIATAGRLTAIKQPELLLGAARLVIDRVGTAVVLIAGDGELRPAVEAQIGRLGLRPHVRLLGWRRDLEVVYAASDVFALTSKNEGTPVALIEAMATAVPGVSTDVGGVAHVIPDNRMGRRVAPDNHQAFAEALLEVLQHPDRSAMGRHARSHVLGRFTRERLERDIAALYDDLLR